VYDDCMRNAIASDSELPQWYLLVQDGTEKERVIVGCAGLIPNDFISRMDLCPWLCALFIEPDFRGNNYGQLLIERCRRDAGHLGYPHLYLATDHIGYYEHFGFACIGTGYHPWGETSRIYQAETK
ncbi:MAG: GNAT family N-acetyltransferase, partial [Eubacteriales bacterium]